MKRSLAVLMDSIADIHPEKDTTLGILAAAQQRGWQLHYIDPASLALVDGEAIAIAHPLQVAIEQTPWFELGTAVPLALEACDCLLMRKDPPVDMEYLYICRTLEFAQRAGCLVVNNPSSLLLCNEKLLAQEFPDLSVSTIVSHQNQQLLNFLSLCNDTVIKPLDNMGGQSVFRVQHKDPQAATIINQMTHDGRRRVMMQQLIPEYEQGDKRILLIEGEAVPYALNRIPAAGKLQANLAAGGRGELVTLDQRDQMICERIASRLKALDLLFVGIDVIGGKLTEINVTSPTCAREISAQSDFDVFERLLDAIEARLL